MDALKQVATVATSSHKAGHAVAAASAGAGVGSVYAVLTGFFSLAAVFLGACLSGVLIYIHWQRWTLEKQKMKLDNEAARLNIEDRRKQPRG